ncbi:unnamed protein product [Spirodela intermedia]|uniref:Knottins-like domain-containing protein n=1 Tax=Spirodela intermedia TaxID=51605 RepID=A0A7I8IYN8_SPIIN|nr:unnamed protein product [Spirodela intermedia]CAA6663116.1 unnamed protein product [Spirodela intermedia]
MIFNDFLLVLPLPRRPGGPASHGAKSIEEYACFKANCATICRTERFSSGYCTTITRACVCTKPCPTQ